MITLIAGARPNFMKIAPIIRALNRNDMPWRLVHTGQHYDVRMSKTFFDELGIPHPQVNLEVGSGSHIQQLAEVMRRLETEFNEYRPSVVVVVGDVNSTVAAAITAKKLGIPVAHVEAGLRSGDRTMPEEINRIITDGISDLLFTSEPAGEENLRMEGIDPSRIYAVGNVMIDTLRHHLEQARMQRNLSAYDLESQEYSVLTLHRPSNVDDPERLESILRAVHEISQKLPVIFPVHPRTFKKLEEFGFSKRADLNGFQRLEPIGYLEMLGLIDAARFVMTDSGGLQEETTALQVPCLTLRENTERPITIESGSNRLVGWRTENILDAFPSVVDVHHRSCKVPDLWDGAASERISRHLKELF